MRFASSTALLLVSGASVALGAAIPRPTPLPEVRAWDAASFESSMSAFRASMATQMSSMHSSLSSQASSISSATASLVSGTATRTTSAFSTATASAGSVNIGGQSAGQYCPNNTYGVNGQCCVGGDIINGKCYTNGNGSVVQGGIAIINSGKDVTISTSDANMADNNNLDSTSWHVDGDFVSISTGPSPTASVVSLSAKGAVHKNGAATLSVGGGQTMLLSFAAAAGAALLL